MGIAPQQYYTEQLNLAEQRLASANKQAGNIAWLRLLAILGLAVALYYTFTTGRTHFAFIDAALFAAVLFVIKQQDKIKRNILQHEKHIQIIRGEEDTLQGNIQAFPDGRGYISAKHPYSFDLDMFGPRSIYQMLNRTVTEQGADALADSLLQPFATAEEIKTRQELTIELSTMPAYLHSFRIAGLLAREEKGSADKIVQWLNSEEILLGNKIMAVATILVPILSALFLFLSFTTGAIHPGLIVMFAINGIAYRVYMKKIKVAYYLVSNSIKLVHKTEAISVQIALQEFKHPELVKMKEEATGTLAAVTGLRKLVNLFDNRQNGMVGPLLNSLFLFDIRCTLKLEKWRREHKDKLILALSHIGQADKNNSYANYAFNHPGHIYPVINSESNIIEATDLRHPLMKHDIAVGNDCSLGRDEKIYLLTGANMTGKSTFIRTIGVNIVLAQAGAPIPAKALSIPLVKIFTSIRISDSIQDDVSYFKAELKRLQHLMKAVQHTDVPYLVLIDEPLRGTNTADKQSGTTSILKKLIGCNVTGIVATHDTGLCIMAEQYPGKISNYHFESEVKDGQLTFDYKLKIGGSTSSNATLLIKMMGIID
ncbi:MAG: hypothetical protein KDC07_03070 [Chitinophagaceae bacterium]|nr:hypothetical protein [Chitinophagaceae bacterium]MCB9045361.1 hypothetical protein [Chitinophagales bacterium]